MTEPRRGSPAAVDGGGKRISEHAPRTRQLEAERGWLEAVIRHMPGGVVLVDASTRDVVLGNEEATRLLGRLPLCTGAQPEGSWLEDALNGGSGIDRELVAHRRPDGTDVQLEVSAAPVQAPEGGTVAAVLILSDVTERERKAQAEREFLTNAAHELQTPLAAILSATEVLRAGAKDIPADRDRFLEHIHRQCTRLVRLLRALLVLARAQMANEPPVKGRIELRPLLLEVCSSLRPAESVEVQVSCPARLSVLADRELIEQAVLAVAANAARYTQAGRIQLAARAEGRDRAVIEISDTGPGIPPDQADRVFQRFYQAKGDGDGFGLGLAIATEAARVLGGRLDLESAPGEGTRARFELPRRRARGE